MNGVRKRGRPVREDEARYRSAVLGLRAHHPELSANEIARIVGCGRRFVAKVMEERGLPTYIGKKLLKKAAKKQYAPREKPKPPLAWDFSGENLDFL